MGLAAAPAAAAGPEAGAEIHRLLPLLPFLGSLLCPAFPPVWWLTEWGDPDSHPGGSGAFEFVCLL